MSDTTRAPYFLVLEGLDASGKSTVARYLKQALDATTFATPLPTLRGVREQVDEVMQTPLSRKLWYAAQVVEASERARQELALGRSVVLDRYWLSTLAYSAYAGELSRLEDVTKTLLVPDLTVFLRLPLVLRRERLLRRGCCLPHDQIFLQEAEDAKLTAIYLELASHPVAGRFVEIEVKAEDTPAQVAAKILLCLFQMPLFPNFSKYRSVS